MSNIWAISLTQAARQTIFNILLGNKSGAVFQLRFSAIKLACGSLPLAGSVNCQWIHKIHVQHEPTVRQVFLGHIQMSFYTIKRFMYYTCTDSVTTQVTIHGELFYKVNCTTIHKFFGYINGNFWRENVLVEQYGCVNVLLERRVRVQ